jgi:hypothetical protein
VLCCDIEKRVAVWKTSVKENNSHLYLEVYDEVRNDEARSKDAIIVD